MNLDLSKLHDLVERKSKIDQSSSWSDGSSTYLVGLKKEIEEVELELEDGNERLLAEELGDVLWDYLNLVKCLEDEKGISFQDVLRISEEKYDERISGIEQGRSWQDIKHEQKLRAQDSYRK